MENVNSNHSPSVNRSDRKSVKPTKGKRSKTNSQEEELVEPVNIELLNGFDPEQADKVEFEEEGEIIEMETNDGGAAKRDFHSDEDEQDSDSDDEDESQDEGTMSHNEDQDNDYQDNEANTSAVSYYEESDNEPTPKKKKTSRKSYRRSMDEKLNSLTDSVKIMQEMMLQQQLQQQQLQAKQQNQKESNQVDTPKKNRNSWPETKGNVENEGYESDTTIYHNILKKVTPKNKEILRVDPEVSFRYSKANESSSSDEQINTSDEVTEMDVDINEQFISDCNNAARKRTYAEAGTSRQADKTRPRDREAMNPDSVEAHRAEEVREREASKARMFATPGNSDNINGDFNCLNVNGFEANQGSPPLIQQYSSMVDENYLVIGSHVDGTTQNKILNNEYVDFSRLLPHHEDSRMELINKGGQSFFIPASDRESGNIHSFAKWEQAFRVFSNIYTRKYPGKATELIQYNHVIYSASQTFTWENVYLYDREFRMHLSNFPQRSWSVILQQAWSMYLKDRIKLSHENHRQGNGKHHKDECKRSIKVYVHQVGTVVMTTVVCIVANLVMELTYVRKE